MRLYIVCAYCERSRAVNADGRVRQHGKCPGSGKPSENFPRSPKTEYEAMKATKAEATLTTFNDGKFVRTAIVANETSSIDVVNAEGERIAQINIFAQPGREILMVDVIDVENRFKIRRVIGFPKNGRPQHAETGKVAAVHFETISEDEAETAFDSELTPDADTSIAGEYTTGEGKTVTLDDEGNPV